MSADATPASDARVRHFALSGLAAATLAAWVATGAFAWAMATMDHAAMPALNAQTWSVTDFALAFLMWVAMMAAMMLPSAAPMIDAFATIAARRRARGAPYTPTAIFVLGYLLAWSCFSAFATALQWSFHKAAWLTPMMANASPVLAGVLLLAAGIYQWTPLKRACLALCRSPAAFVLAEWREGRAGAAVMGLRHGAFCVGCCWALMGLLFAVAVMDLRWVAALAAVVMIEKMAPHGETIARAIGVAAAVAGLVVLVKGLTG